jgi:tetratricopeptide (TPR) repeat protein
VEAFALLEQGPFLAMLGRFDEARELYRQGKEALDELGLEIHAAGASQEYSEIEMLAGDPAAAARQLRSDYDELTRMGERYLLSTIAGELARAHYFDDDLEAALEMTRVAEDLSAEDDIGSQALWRSVRARVLARRGETEAAIELAQEAIEVLEESDVLVRQADALLDLADVLELAGDHEHASKTLGDAAALLERKGNVVALEQVAAVMATADAR